jgi:hypothetical protein
MVNGPHCFGIMTGKKEEVLRSSDRLAVQYAIKKVATYSGSVEDQALMSIMTGEL